MTCEICDYADEHKRWPMAGTHCRDCHKSWRGTGLAHCTICHEHFATNKVADRHWVKTGHVHPSEVEKLLRWDDGIWHSVVSDEVRSRLPQKHAVGAIPAA